MTILSERGDNHAYNKYADFLVEDKNGRGTQKIDSPFIVTLLSEAHCLQRRNLQEEAVRWAMRVAGR
jgi:hypothetical protein